MSGVRISLGALSILKRYNILLSQGGEVVSRCAHNAKTTGAIPVPAITPLYPLSLLTSRNGKWNMGVRLPPRAYNRPKVIMATVKENEDGSTSIVFSEEECERLSISVGDRLVWTVTETSISVKKRRKNYKLRPNEYDTFLTED